MAQQLIKRGYYFTPELLAAWQKFHAPSRDYSPSAAAAFLLYMAVDAETRELARRLAVNKNIKSALKELRREI